MKPIVDFLNKSDIKLSSKHQQLLLNNINVSQFNRNENILLEGEKSNHLYYIISGIVRGYYVDKNGNEFTKCFSSENDFFSSEGLRTKCAATFSIQCVENVNCLKIPYNIINQISEEDIQLDNFINHCYTLEVTRLEARQKILLLHNATEQYNLFCELFPHLYSRIPLMHIASYMGIRSASLSRIRKNKTHN